MEGTKTPRKFYLIFSCVGRFEEVISMSCGRCETVETPQTRSVEEARRSPAESEVPATEINNAV